MSVFEGITFLWFGIPPVADPGCLLSSLLLRLLLFMTLTLYVDVPEECNYVN